MDKAKMDEAWTAFDKAVSFEEKSKEGDKTEAMQRMALRAADKHLDKAVALEAEALSS